MKKFILLLLLGNLFQNNIAQIVGAKHAGGGMHGFVDAKGEWVIEPIYEFTYWHKDWEHGIIRKEYGGPEGLIDISGRIIYPIGDYKGYHFATNSKGGLVYLTSINGKKGMGNLSGQVIIPCIWKGLFLDAEERGIFVENDNGLKGLYTLEGKELVPCKWTNMFYSSSAEGIVVEDSNGMSGLYTLNGWQIIPCMFKNIWSDGTSIIVVNNKKEWGIYSNDGKMLVPCEYNSVELAAKDIYLVRKGSKYINEKLEGGKYGYYANGKEIIPCIYDDATVFNNDVATVKLDGEVKMLKNPLKDASQIQITSSDKSSNKKGKGPVVSRYPAPDSDVDKNIPTAKASADNTFAFIIANENYPDAPVPYSLNDGRMFKEYCQKALGLPEKNINLYEDATFGNIITAVEKMKQIADAYDGDASVIFYYAGHGFPDEKQSTAYLLPIDGNASDITTTGYSLAKLYKELSELKLKSSIVFLDACFSGTKREDQMLSEARGVAIKVKEEAPQGNMLVFSAAQGDETAHQMEEKHHGLFTYYLLKELQSTGGDVDMGTLTEYVTKQVKRQSVVMNNKKQTPTVIPSQSLMNSWQTMKLK